MTKLQWLSHLPHFPHILSAHMYLCVNAKVTEGPSIAFFTGAHTTCTLAHSRAKLWTKGIIILLATKCRVALNKHAYTAKVSSLLLLRDPCTPQWACIHKYPQRTLHYKCSYHCSHTLRSLREEGHSLAATPESNHVNTHTYCIGQHAPYVKSANAHNHTRAVNWGYVWWEIKLDRATYVCMQSAKNLMTAATHTEDRAILKKIVIHYQSYI